MMSELRHCLHLSLARYEEILAEFARIEETLRDVSAAELLACADALWQAQQQAAAQDQAIHEWLRTRPPEADEAELVEQWVARVERVLECNRLLSEKIRGMMAAISSELNQFRGGRMAMAGYRQGAKARGAVLSDNF